MNKPKVIFTFLLLGAALAACASESPSSTPTISPTRPAAGTFAPTGLPRLTRTPTAQATPTPAPARPPADLDELDGLTIQFWYVWENAYTEDVYRTLAEAYSEINPYGLTIEAAALGSYTILDEAVRAAIRDGGLPDVASGYPYQYLTWQAQGDVLMDLTPYASDAEVGLEEGFLDGLYPGLAERDIFEGQRLGFPAPQTATLMFYNQSWGQELGFTNPPATSEAFRQQTCAAAEANNDLTGGWLINTRPGAAFGWVRAFGAQIEAEGEYSFETPELGAAFTFLQELKAEGCAWRPRAGFPSERFAEREGLVYTAPVGMIPEIQTAFELAENPDAWVPLPFPATEGEQALPVDGPAYVLVKSTPAEQLAGWLFLEYLLQPENQARLAESSGRFPASRSAVELVNRKALPEQWFAAAELLELSEAPPARISWGTVQLALADAANELFRDSFSLDLLGELSAELQSTAEELAGESGE